jgi:hypothetical protein
MTRRCLPSVPFWDYTLCMDYHVPSGFEGQQLTQTRTGSLIKLALTF